jgi:hypothetical protein
MARSKRGVCRLHMEEGVLRYGHVTPRFVYRWQGAGSRSIGHPNLRREDGPRRHLFCAACEERLSGWETKVQRRIFEPLHGGRARLEYGPWFAKFAASLVFRVLIVCKEEHELDEFPSASLARVDEALDTWRSYLTETPRTLGEFDVHALALDPVSDRETASLYGPGINTYLALAVGNQVLRTSKGCFVVGKMGRLLIIGAVQNRSGWSEGTIDQHEGVLVGGHSRIPVWLRQYFNDQTVRSMQAFTHLSERQRQRIATERATSEPSNRFRDALRLDVQVFGWRALAGRIGKGHGPAK